VKSWLAASCECTDNLVLGFTALQRPNVLNVCLFDVYSAVLLISESKTTRVRMDIPTHTHTHTHTHTFIHTYTYTSYIYTCIYVYIHTHRVMHTYIHSRLHIKAYIGSGRVGLGAIVHVGLVLVRVVLKLVLLYVGSGPG
jgi:hypothetical protein